MNWNDVIMKKRKFSRWILLLCCLFIPAFTAGAKAPLGTPTREVLLDMAWDCLEEYNFSCIRTNAVAVSKATQIMSEKEEQTETQQVETEQQTEEQSSETSFDVTQYIFVGDSRTVGMHEQSEIPAACGSVRFQRDYPGFRILPLERLMSQ